MSIKNSVSFESLTIILPIIDEIESLKKTIDIICKHNPNEDIKFLFVCHKNKTSTKSIATCDHYIKNNSSKFKLIYQNLPNLGGAIRNGFKEVDTSHCVMVSSDLETDPYTIKKMIYYIKKSPNSIITGNRWGSEKNFYNYGKLKIFLNFVFQKAFSILYNTKLKDLTFGYRLFPTNVVQDIKWEMYDHSLMFETILKPLKLKIEIIEVNSVWKKRKEGKSSNIFYNYIKYFYIGLKTILYRK